MRDNNNLENKHLNKVRKQTLCSYLLILRVVANNQMLHIIIDMGITINLMNTNIIKVIYTQAVIELIFINSISRISYEINKIATVLLERTRYPYIFDFYIIPIILEDALLDIDATVEVR